MLLINRNPPRSETFHVKQKLVMFFSFSKSSSYMLFRNIKSMSSLLACKSFHDLTSLELTSSLSYHLSPLCHDPAVLNHKHSLTKINTSDDLNKFFLVPETIIHSILFFFLLNSYLCFKTHINYISLSEIFPHSSKKNLSCFPWCSH